MATSASLSAKARATAAPRPRAPPVTSIVLPANVFAIRISYDRMSRWVYYIDRYSTDASAPRNLLSRTLFTDGMVVETGTPWDGHAFDPDKALACARGRLRPGTTTERDRIRRATANVAASPYTSS